MTPEITIKITFPPGGAAVSVQPEAAEAAIQEDSSYIAPPEAAELLTGSASEAAVPPVPDDGYEGESEVGDMAPPSLPNEASSVESDASDYPPPEDPG